MRLFRLLFAQHRTHDRKASHATHQVGTCRVSDVVTELGRKAMAQNDQYRLMN